MSEGPQVGVGIIITHITDERARGEYPPGTCLSAEAVEDDGAGSLVHGFVAVRECAAQGFLGVFLCPQLFLPLQLLPQGLQLCLLHRNLRAEAGAARQVGP